MKRQSILIAGLVTALVASYAVASAQQFGDVPVKITFHFVVKNFSCCAFCLGNQLLVDQVNKFITILVNFI